MLPDLPSDHPRTAIAPTASLRAVLFDMDGTLIDSEKLWTLALQRVARDLGGELSAATRMSMVGTDLVSSVQLLHDDIGYTGDLAVTKRLLVAAAAAEFGGPLDWRPGARELLISVRRAGLATALVTSTHRNLVSMALETIGRGNFDVLVCGDDVTNTKPNPEPYRRALAELEVPADDAIAIEDSPAGSTSALAAGIPTLVVPSELPVPERPGLVLRPSLAEVDLAALRSIWSEALDGRVTHQ
jgi:HAD superfamily hydrolase (TIGR01509 family)